jgi:hypothetical protein
MADVKYFKNHVFKRRATSAAGDFKDDPDTKDPKTKDIVARDFLLFDFDIDWDELKESHKNKLNEAAKFMKFNLLRDKGPGGWEIRIDGFSSKTYMGKEASEKDKTAVEHNDYLSNMREQEVESYLRKAIPNLQIKYVPNWHGFSKHESKGENPIERSVRVHIQRPGLPPPLPKELPSLPAPSPPKDVLDHTWNIRMVGAASAGWKAAIGDLLFFEIWAVNQHYSAIYRYTGAGLAKGTPVSATFKGEFVNPFSTMHEKGNAKSSQPVAFGSFEGVASFFSAGGGNSTINLLKFGGLPPGIVIHPTDPLKINTGTTIGVGISGSFGVLVWSPRILFPRTTPA